MLGEPGVGKSLYALQLAAMVTRGWHTLPAALKQETSGLIDGLNGDGGVTQIPPAVWLAGGNDRFLNADQTVSVSAAGASVSEMPVSEMPGPAMPGPGNAGTVVLFEPGDGASILRSRLEAAGADVEKIILVERNWRGDSEVEEFLESEPREAMKRPSRVDRDRELRWDLESLEQHVVQLKQSGHDVSLVIIDPIESLLRDSLDKYRLARLLDELADRLNVAIVAVGTTSSTPRAYPGLRLDGKGIDALFKASKSVVTVVRDPENLQQRFVQSTKLNLSAAPPGLTFGFQDDGRLEWSQTMALFTEPQDEVQMPPPRMEWAPPDARQEGPDKELNRAMQWLTARLADGGVPVGDVRSGARQSAISKAALQRAYDQLGCVSKKSHGLSGRVWQLPESVDVDGHERLECWNPTQRVNGASEAGVCR